MAVGTYVRQQVAFGLGDRQAATELCDLIDTDGVGSLSTRTKSIIRTAFGSRSDGTDFIDNVEAGAGLTPHLTSLFGAAIGNRNVASLIRDEKLGKQISKSDSITITETVTVLLSHFSSVSDTVTISETIAKSLA